MSHRNPPSSPWFAYRKPRAHPRLRLFCFSYAGGAASVFRTWADELPADLEVCPVQLPGREGRVREAPFTRLEPLVASLTDALAGELTELPAAFFGHSMGALVAFETARELRRRGAREPGHLFVSARRAPHLPARHEPIHALPEAAFRDELRRLQGTPEAVLEHPELMELLGPMLRADFAVIETYEHHPGPPLAAPITAFGGAGDDDVPAEDLEGWSGHTAGGFRRQIFPGGHFFLQHEARGELLWAVATELAPRR